MSSSRRISDIVMERQTQAPSTTNPEDPPLPAPPAPHHEQPLSAMLNLLQEQAHERRLSAKPLAARLLRECGGSGGGGSSSKAGRERAQVTAHEALRLAKNSGGNYYSSHCPGSSSTPRPSSETVVVAAHPQDPPPPEREGINPGVRINRGVR
ncbi:unnamed protein product, partial [Laminaria digitata]